MPVIVAHGLLSASWERWTFAPVTMTLLLSATALYALGIRRLWRHAGQGRGVSRWQAAAFAGSVAAVVVALLSPLDGLSDLLFSAHMTQHEVLMLITAPLLAMSQPLVAYLWAFPPRARALVARATGRPVLRKVWQRLTSPLSAFLLHALALWIWHVPRLYEGALADEGVHALQHLSFTLTATLFWWGMVRGRYGRAGYGVAVLYVFLTAVHSSILGALATVADRAWYPTYATRGEPWQIDPLADQQLAGLIMWIPSGVIFIVMGLGLLAAWLGESERRVGAAHVR